MSVLKIKNEYGDWVSIAAIKGAKGDTGIGIPAGGTTGQVLAKTSGADYDTDWVNQSGGGGTSDYTDLTNKPKINNVELNGNKSLADLGIVIPTVPVTSVNNKTGAVVLNASDVGALPDDTVIPTVPTNVSAFTNDAGYLTSFTEVDPVFLASAAHGISSSDIANWNGKSDFSGSYNDLTNKPTIPTVPTNVSAFTNDAGYLTSFTETDPTVPSWAKEASKPSYSASEISGLIDMFYPIGSYYETSDSTFNPNTAWGGTWSLEAEGLVHIGAGSNYTIGDTGGSADAIVPYHRHKTNDEDDTLYFMTENYGTAGGIGEVRVTASTSGTNYVPRNTSSSVDFAAKQYTAYAGTSGNSNNANMQPYIVVNRWHRTA